MEPEQYGLMARVEGAHWWYAGMRQIVAALLDSALRQQAGDASDGPPRVLDAGCGTGGTTAWLRRYGAVAGVDLSLEAAPFWGQRGLRQMALASVDALPFADATFDLVTCFDVLYHRDVGDETAALAAFWRVLRPDGLLLLRLPAYNWLRSGHDAAVHTRRRYTRHEVARAVREAGFRVVAATYANSLLFPLALAKRLGEHVFGASQTEMTLPPPPLNRLLQATLGLEARLVARGSLPWGLSALVLGRKLGAASVPLPAARPSLAMVS